MFASTFSAIIWSKLVINSWFNVTHLIRLITSLATISSSLSPVTLTNDTAHDCISESQWSTRLHLVCLIGWLTSLTWSVSFCSCSRVIWDEQIGLCFLADDNTQQKRFEEPSDFVCDHDLCMMAPCDFHAFMMDQLNTMNTCTLLKVRGVFFATWLWCSHSQLCHHCQTQSKQVQRFSHVLKLHFGASTTLSWSAGG